MIEANQESILVSQSSQTRSLETETSNACIQANLSAPQISQASQAQTEETNASVQTILEAHQIHANQDESIQASMLVLQPKSNANRQQQHSYPSQYAHL